MESITVDDLKNLVGELRMMARGLLAAESGAHSFTPTALAMTALRRAKLKDQNWEDVRWENRAHFFSALSTALRHALIDHARRRKAKGRGEIVFVAPDESVLQNLPDAAEERPERIIFLEEAVARLDATDGHLGQIVQQFYYAGYSATEMARFAGVCEKTVDRDLRRARVFLRKIMDEMAAGG